MAGKANILTDFDAAQIAAVEVCAAKMGMPLSTWVGEAVTRTMKSTRSAPPHRPARSERPPEKERNQIRIRVTEEVRDLLVGEATSAGVGVSTLVREIALAAAAAGHLGLAGKLAVVASLARRRTATLRMDRRPADW